MEPPRDIAGLKSVMLRKAGMILSGNAATAAMLLARNLLVARLIPVEDFGIASTFAVTMAIVEMLSALGLQQQIIRDSRGEDPRLQHALQGFQVMRGLISASVLWLIADPIAAFLGIPEAAWAYKWLALVPLLNALIHFDIYRLSRKMRFGPMLLTATFPAFVSLAMVWPIAKWLGDYRVLLWAILAQSLLAVVTSHLVAERPYRIVFDRKIIADSLRFGWPILVNGMLLFAVFNGDRLIVGHTLGMEQLAIFSLGLTLTLTPTLVLEKSAQSFFLPQLTTAMAERPQFDRLSMVAFQAHLACGLLLICGVIFLGPALVTLTLGDKYNALLPLLPWLAIQQALRIAKGGNSPSALAMAQTSNSMLGSLPRALCLMPAGWAVSQGASVLTIIQIGIIGELLGYALTLLLTRWRMSLPLRPLLLPSTLFGATLVAVAVTPIFVTPLLAQGIIALLAAINLFSMSDLIRYLQHRSERPS